VGTGAALEEPEIGVRVLAGIVAVQFLHGLFEKITGVGPSGGFQPALSLVIWGGDEDQ
jgi:hypothetical protein